MEKSFYFFTKRLRFAACHVKMKLPGLDQTQKRSAFLKFLFKIRLMWKKNLMQAYLANHDQHRVIMPS